MFVGHLAAAFAAKGARPRLSLGWYLAAATAPDLLWPILLLLGVERAQVAPGATAFNPLIFEHYPWSHSLLSGFILGAVLAAAARWRGADRFSATLLGACVLSHWVLDFVTHAPDLPLWPGQSPRFGLGLWNSVAGTFAVEGSLWVAALALYLARRQPAGWRGSLALWSLVAVSTVLWAGGPWSPPPPSVTALAWFALVGWLVIPWGAAADRYYRKKPAPELREDNPSAK
ncbi:hypothetical protein HRbin33_01496 [bacterium HR33]|nr:hypothetical protein HRbin33_01496 [bacterium HR33]